MKNLPVMDQEPTPKLRNSLRWPWVCIAIVLLAGAVIAIRFCRREQPSRSTETKDPGAPVAAQGQPVIPEARNPKAGESDDARAVSAADISQGLGKVKALVEKGDLLGAREEGLGLLKAAEAVPERPALEELLGQIHTNLVFTQALMPEKTNHVIQAGENLETIARRYRTTVELLQAGNGISNPARIRKGDVLRPLTGVFRIEVRRASHDLVLYLNDRFFRRYIVGTGKHEKTPVGSFLVVDRIREPVWWHPDGKQIPYGHPDNILGTRWLALKATGDTPDFKGYGIHGTWDDASVGKSASAGCVRMRNRDVEELFILVPNGTAVQILDK